MLDYNQLKKLKAANEILNEKYKELGLRPMKFKEPATNKLKPQKSNSKALNEYMGQEPKPNEKKDPSKQEIENYLQNHSTPTVISHELEEKEKQSKVPFKISLNAISLSTMLLLVFMLAINADFRQSTMTLFGFNKKQSQSKKSKSLFKVITLEDRPAIITSGTYNTIEEADQAMMFLLDEIGGSLNIVKIKNYYTIQVGPSYKDYNDALMVFRDLLKYPIPDIAIKIK